MAFDAAAIKQSFSRAAGEYDAHAKVQREVLRHAASLAVQHMPAQAKLLDIGCGTGALMDCLPEGNAWNVTGLDIAFGMCAAACDRKPVAMQTICASMESLPIADASMDGVFSSLALQWANDPAAAWREFARVTKQGGAAIVATLGSGTLRELREASRAMDGESHVHDFLTHDEIVKHAKAAGWRILAAEPTLRSELVPDLATLLRSLHAIGAGNKMASRKRGLTTQSAFSRLQSAYERMRTPQGLPATWDILTLVLRK